MPPSVNLAQVIEAATAPNAEVRKLASMVSRVPGLEQRVQRYAKAFYARGNQQYKDSARTLVLVGPKVLREVAIHHAIVAYVQGLELPSAIRAAVLLDLARRAVGCRLLADRMEAKLNIDEAFTIGLCLDVGTAALLAERPLYADWYSRVRGARGAARLELERAIFGRDHVAAFVGIAADLGLPAAITDIVAEHHSTQATSGKGILAAAAFADSLGEAHTALDSAPALDRWIDDATVPLWCSSDEAWELLERVDRDVDLAAQTLEVTVGARAYLDDLRERKLEEFSADVLDGPELIEWASVLEAQVAHLQQTSGSMADRLSEMNGRDPLTGLVTHRVFLEDLEREVANSRANDADLWLLLVDVDRFTELNRRSGFSVGDQALKTVCEVLAKMLPDARGMARVGPDEVAVLVESDDWRIRLVAERCRAAIEATKMVIDGQRLRVSASVYCGGLSSVSNDASHEALYSAVRMLLRNSRRSGNQVYWLG